MDLLTEPGGAKAPVPNRCQRESRSIRSVNRLVLIALEAHTQNRRARFP